MHADEENPNSNQCILLTTYDHAFPSTGQSRAFANFSVRAKPGQKMTFPL